MSVAASASPPPAPAAEPEPRRDGAGPLSRWAALGAVIAVGTLLGDAVGLPSAGLFAGMLAGIAYALTLAPRAPLRTPGWAQVGSEAVVGVTIGAYVELNTVKAIGSDLIPIAVVTVLTLALTVVAGLVLAKVTNLDRATAAFGMIAGGATGIIVISERLGADERVVAVLQYLRVLVVMALTPLVAAVVFSGASGGSGGGLGGHGAWLEGLAFCVVAGGVGLLLAQRVPMPAPTLLWPLLIAGALTVGGVFDAGVPSVVGQVAFAVIGVKVGLGFTRAALMDAGRALPAALAIILLLLVGCGLLALALAPLTDVSTFDAYLATTPGGLYAVLAVAVGGGANTTFVLAVQVLRVFVMLGAAPLLARRLAARGDASAAAAARPADTPA